jgi:hypothetical protein
MKKRHADAPTESERSQKRHKKPKVTETVSEESSEEYEVPEVDSDYSDGDYSEGKSKKKKGSTKAKPPQKAVRLSRHCSLLVSFFCLPTKNNFC